jgi:hypothetical protein
VTWTYYPDSYKFRDDDTGRFASKRDVWKWSDASMDEQAAQTRGLAAELTEGGTVGAWEAEMRRRIKAEYIRQYLLGRGGRNAMTAEDWGSLGGMIADQYRYLDGFAAEIAAGKLSEAMIAARSEMYLLSAREAFNRAQARARGIPADRLPAFPGDGASCFFWSDRVRVLTLEHGAIRLSSVKVGDSVLTHQGRYRKVLGLTSIPVEEDVLAVQLEVKFFKKPVKCAVTPDHLFLTEDGWVRADSLRAGDKLGRLGERPLFNHGGDYKLVYDAEIVSLKRKPMHGTVKCLVVEEDSSFAITRGLISHNCLGLTRCGCTWDFRKKGDTWECYWLLNPAKENCELCIQHASEWGPFTIEAEKKAVKAGRFVTIEDKPVFIGGPGQGGGSSSGSNGAGTALSEDGIVKVSEMELRYLSYLRDRETGIIFDIDGNEITRTGGDSDVVVWSDDDIVLMKDAVMTHNHPVTGGSFSISDVELAMKADMVEIRAVGRDSLDNVYVYRLTRPPAGWGELGKYYETVGTSNDAVKNELWAKINDRVIAPSKAEFTHNHEVMKRVADRMGWNYEMVGVQ